LFDFLLHQRFYFEEFVACENITGEEICKNLIESLSKAGLDTQFCRSQTMDGAGNMSGKYLENI
jgi:hypothetical protein